MIWGEANIGKAAGHRYQTLDVDAPHAAHRGGQHDHDGGPWRRNDMRLHALPTREATPWPKKERVGERERERSDSGISPAVAL